MKKLLALIAFCSLSNCLMAQSVQEASITASLYDTIRLMDRVFFRAFNTCDTTTSKLLFTRDLEFYHDAGGLTGYDENLKSIRYRCSSKAKVRRELVDGSLEVYPIANYGAIEIGKHKFYYTEPGKKEQLDGTFRFVHIWIHKDHAWKISRVISYDH